MNTYIKMERLPFTEDDWHELEERKARAKEYEEGRADYLMDEMEDKEDED